MFDPTIFDDCLADLRMRPFNHKNKRLRFKGGGGGDSYDAAYNARMATIAEKTQGMADEYFKFWQTDYQPFEKAQIAANMEMLPGETALSKAQTESAMSLLPGQTKLTQAQMDSAMTLLPGQTQLAQEQITDTLTGIKEKAPVRTAFYNEALKGIDVDSAVSRAAADASQAFMNSNSALRRNAARMGINPTSGAFLSSQNSNALTEAKTVAAAKTNARVGAEEQNFQRLQSAMSF